MPSVKQSKEAKSSRNLPPRYTVIIQWSEEDDCYVVSLPEWGTYAKTHGATYEEAAKNAREVLELLMAPEPGHAQCIPLPRLFHYPGTDVVDLPETAVGKPLSELGKSRRSA